MSLSPDQITGVVLAGGRGRRMEGRDKGLIAFRGRPLAAYALDALEAVCGRVMISANRNHAEYAQFGHAVIADGTDSFDGPLAGLLSAMAHAETPYLLAVPCDLPLLTAGVPRRLCLRLAETGAAACTAYDGERLHPLVLLVESHLAGNLSAYLASGQRKVEVWLRQQNWVAADCGDVPNQFLNANSPDDLAAMESSLPPCQEPAPLT